MSGPAGFLEFFILEASDYVEQLDRLLLDGGASGPDTGALQRVARALRGTATMAKLPSFAGVAAALERVGRALQEGTIRWDPALGGALVSAIDDLRILLRGARTWSAEEEHRARSRAADLSRYAPIVAGGGAGTPGTSGGRDLGPAATSAFLSTEAANIAAGLELLTTHGGDSATAANVLRRVRALRGVAGVSEIGPLADVLEATEESGRSLETGESMTPEVRTLLEAAAAHLRTLSAEVRTGGDVNAPSSTRDAFEAARDALATPAAERERVVPIEELFYPEDTGVVEAAAAPPTSASDRFRLELVSLGEHLRQVVASARRATEPASVARSRREITRAMRALEAAAASFGHREIADAIADRARETEGLGGANLALLDQLAVQLSRPDLSVEELRAALVPVPPPPPPRPTPREPVNAASLIDSTLFALDELEPAAFAERVAIPEDTVVPIEALLYRGRAALDRAVEIRDALRTSGSYDDREALDELFDLLDLARAE